MRRRLFLLFLLTLLAPAAHLWQARAQTPNERQARRIFDKVYRQVFDSDGCSLSYDINLIHIYKTSGRVWFRRKLMRFTEKRYEGWVDAETWHMVDKKKKVVELHKANSNRTGMKTDDFAFQPDCFTFHIQREGDGYRLTLDAKEGKQKIKHAQVLLDRDQHPTSLRIKVLFFWTTIRISHFSLQPLTEASFRYPAERYADYEIEDHRADE